MPRWIASILLLFLCTSVAQAQQKTETTPKGVLDALDDQRLIAPGHVLSIRILEERLEPEECKVPENGKIEVRHLGGVKVEGMTCRKLSQLIAQKLTSSPAYTQILASQRPLAGLKPPTVSVIIHNIGTCVPNAMGDPKPAVKLRPGQTIGIRILEDKREKIHLIIPNTGEINAPYVGPLKASGLTSEEFAANLKSELEKSFFLRATVLVTLEESLEGKVIPCFPQPGVISIQGRVVRAGTYELPQKSDLNVSHLLAWAGGHTAKKQVPTIKILRKTPVGIKTILVDTSAALVRKSKEHDLPLRADDVMLVE